MTVPQRAPTTAVSQPLPLADEEIAAWLIVSTAPDVPAAALRQWLAAFGLPLQILAQPTTALARLAGEAAALALRRAATAPPQAAIEQAIAWCRAAGRHFVTLADPAYPAMLLELSDPPPVLYVLGRLDLLHRRALAIVGSRHATAQGLANAEQFAATLAAAGLTIVSGLALGIDGAAHRGALASPAGTVAVIGTGADIVYPSRHHALAHEIATRGAIVSAWPLGAPARREHFPQRNRLIAALSRGVLVVEAAAQSGSLITARLANELGREVMAIPGSIHSPLAKGCHQLIKQGAKLVESAQDVLDELGPSEPAQPSSHADLDAARRSTGQAAGSDSTSPPTHCAAGSDAIGARVLAALGHDPAVYEQLAVRTGLSHTELQSALLRLELDRRIERLAGGRIAPFAKP